MISIKLRRDRDGRILRDDSGSALVIALVFMTVFSLIIAVILGLVDTSFRATLAVRDQADSMYAGDAAIDAAINFYRYEFRDGRVHRPCPTYGPLTIRGYKVTVTCEGLGGSGTTVIPNFDETLPQQAILTLSTSTVIPGIDQTSNDTVRIKGDIWSQSRIDIASNGILDVEGAVTARTGCNTANKIIATTLTCSTSTLRADPYYPMATTTVPPPPASMPSCTDLVLKFLPGAYTNVAALNALTGPGATACTGKTYWFQPGLYYFDFQDGDLWDIKQGLNDAYADYVAGTPRNWDPNSLIIGANRPVFGESCKTEDDFAGNVDPPLDTGVQFIFGGVSRMSITSSGEFEMCAQPSPRTTAPQQQIAIFGVTATSGTSGVPTDAPPANPTGATSPATLGRLAFVPATNALTFDSNYATAPLNSATPVADIRLTNLCDNCIPANSTINDVKLVFRHREATNRVAQITGTASWVSGGLPTSTTIPEAGTCTTTRICRHNNASDDQIDIDSMGLDTISELNSGVTVTYEARWGSGTATQAAADLDGIRLEINYTPPSTGFRAQSGGLVALDSNSTPLLEATGPNTGVAIHGTVYAPLSGIDITLNLKSTEAVDRGAVVRFVKLHTPASGLFEGYPISLPEGSRAGRGILLRSIVDPPDGDPRVRVRAVIDVDDGCVVLPCEIGQTLTVRSWSFVR